MKKVQLILLLSLIQLGCLFADFRYVGREIYPEGSNFYDLNNFDDIAFVGLDEKENCQIYYYSNNHIIQVTNSDNYVAQYYYNVDLNDNGEVVWYAEEKQADGTLIKSIKHFNPGGISTIYTFPWIGNSGPQPKINNDGIIVWSYPLAYGLHPEIFLYDKHSITNITQDNNPDNGPVINDDYVVWFGDNREINDWSNSVQYYDIKNKKHVTISEKNASFPVIDDENNILFQVLSGNTKILKMFHDEKIVTIDTGLYGENYSLSCGKIVWIASNDLSVHLHGNGMNSIVSSPGHKYYFPQINCDGIITWKDENNNPWVKKGSFNTLAGDSGTCHGVPIINKNGRIAWKGYDWDYYGASIYVSDYLDVYDVSGEVNEGTILIQVLTGIKDVLITSGNTKTMSGVDGKFKLLNLSKGENIIKFEKSGYIFTPQQISVNIDNKHIQLEEPIIGSKSSDIAVDESISLIEILPNPASDYIEIKIIPHIVKASDVSDGIKIYNTFGECVMDITPKFSEGVGVRINVSGLPAGMYYYTIRVGDRIESGKLILIK